MNETASFSVGPAEADEMRLFTRNPSHRRIAGGGTNNDAGAAAAESLFLPVFSAASIYSVFRSLPSRGFPSLPCTVFQPYVYQILSLTTL